jgi:hypothetical protein
MNILGAYMGIIMVGYHGIYIYIAYLNAVYGVSENYHLVVFSNIFYLISYIMIRLAYIAGKHDDKYGWRSIFITTVTTTTTIIIIIYDY